MGRDENPKGRHLLGGGVGRTAEPMPLARAQRGPTISSGAEPSAERAPGGDPPERWGGPPRRDPRAEDAKTQRLTDRGGPRRNGGGARPPRGNPAPRRTCPTRRPAGRRPA